MKPVSIKSLIVIVLSVIFIANITFLKPSLVNAKSYKTYTSPVFDFWDNESNYNFYTGPYKKTLPSKLIVSNPKKSGPFRYTSPQLIIYNNNLGPIYSNSDMSSGLIDYLQFTSNKKGYLNLFFLMGDKNGNIEYSLIAVSPSGKTLTQRSFRKKGGVHSIKFVSLNKVKLVRNIGPSVTHTFNNLKIK